MERCQFGRRLCSEVATRGRFGKKWCHEHGELLERCATELHSNAQKHRPRGKRDDDDRFEDDE